jgi:hypothetical protein
MTARGYSRGQTFFGAHVQPGFIESNSGQAILHEFRWCLWRWAFAGALISLFVPVSLSTLAGCMLSSLAGMVAFALANRRTRRVADTRVESAVRVASLSIERGEESPWLGVLDWLTMLVPPVVPAATLVLLALHWGQLPTDFHRGARVFVVFFSLIMGLTCMANQLALRFRARSRDWAPMAHASHRYRSYLGAMQALVFVFITFQLCVLVLMPLSGTVSLLHQLNMSSYFRISFPAQALWLLSIWRIRLWLTRHLATESIDPMSDKSWKWGYFYFNPNDPALVVPLRTGVGQSFNCARPSIWLIGGTVTLLTIACLIQAVGSLIQIDRALPN